MWKLNKIHRITLIGFFIFSAGLGNAYSQTAGFSYQALILNEEQLEVPGPNIENGQVPLALEEVEFRFSILNENEEAEYIEQQMTTTSENGMVALVVGEGEPSLSRFEDIQWGGLPKSLSVEINIISNGNGFEPLDTQKILYVPHPASSNNIRMVETLAPITADSKFDVGEMMWVENYGEKNISTVVIWDGEEWEPISMDIDSSNELHLITVANLSERDQLFASPVVGEQLWNVECGCMEVYNGNEWQKIQSQEIIQNQENITAQNGIVRDGDSFKLGGALTESTVITTSADNTLAINGLEMNTDADSYGLLTVGNLSGVIKKVSTDPYPLEIQQVTLTANTNSQRDFSLTLTLPTSKDNIEVYRNGIRVDFERSSDNDIRLEDEASCYVGDEIRIVLYD